jgi:hypothetical protein
MATRYCQRFYCPHCRTRTWQRPERDPYEGIELILDVIFDPETDDETD